MFVIYRHDTILHKTIFSNVGQQKLLRTVTNKKNVTFTLLDRI